MKKTLRLRSESLADLSADELGTVVAAAATYNCSTPNCPSIDFCNPLPTTPVRDCLPPKLG